jgi:hypothetical protein
VRTGEHRGAQLEGGNGNGDLNETFRDQHVAEMTSVN